ncbi:hypothetical protein MJO29_014242 [Puccinia striiformis f. sp. tritici]|uniref:AMMECR1 domain-containing protein n=1 Tax=Puccinia striiformis f. sp. tritici PST-78 TaxID=1165861 RepID=A0A0L0W3K2_9BASI|nr:hypothetical protein Pst134EA_026828 [Puccinia striiformis f. sp. tritici]KAI9626519.1 hypothetical protein KEM48_010347 [Puccinia striiformis f. sp. tritici PST-130]KNF06091.1 hypothetical protein PSTG_00603 [Puccinia striiformis f. sp. tritici PST-78]KAH9443040.1 hypothetical protein Pst134EB_027394 [Puccinia striiformis f. sp. tritici]KAH9450118.1 hypothetical protein Pst134EA_026828 [Puccinia striiformis f. sp. tritici]KAI7939506.1 hypothetical protein MJO29_014242 [Puccinia striiformis
MLENAFTEWAAEQPASDPTDPAGIQHCLFCFDSLYFELNRQSHRGKNDEYLLNQLEDTIGATEFPLFVTWNIISNGGHPKLRGCIGNFAPSPLNEGLKDYAVISALKDHRFSPVTLADLKRLSCTVSLLHTFEDCATFTDWTIGQHGIYIHIPNPDQPITSNSSSEPITPSSQDAEISANLNTLADVLSGVQATQSTRRISRNRPRSWVGQKRGHMMSATYLPDVASEQGWTKIEAIDSAIRKAGWKGSITPALRSSLIVERYQSSKHTATYQDWSDWREKLGFPL